MHVDYARLFDATPSPQLVLDPDLMIVEVNQAYLQATGRRREDLIGKGVFEAFPANPADPEADGVHRLKASLVQARDTKRPDTMPVQKYDIPNSDGGGFEERYWSPINVPVFDAGGDVAWLLHRVEDLTSVVRAQQRATGAGAPLGEDGREVVDAAVDLYLRGQELQADRDAARRIAVAQRRIAETLQRSLLTEPPEPDHLQIAVRYLPAAQEAYIGGDWYDAFMSPDGAATVVIGDVAGHDRHAAAVMGQIRNVLRGVVQATGQPPAATLSVLDSAMDTLGMDFAATAVVAQVEQTKDSADEGVRVLRWSNAGHLPPLLLQAGGDAVLLHRPADLLLGVERHTARHDHDVVLEPGATLVLYTDGLIERRGQSLTDGLERLRLVGLQLGDHPLEDLCDALMQRLGDGAEDDVAVLAIRAHRQDQPRPPEAGPEKLKASELSVTTESASHADLRAGFAF